MYLEPLFNYVVVEKDAEKEETAGGILIPDNSKEKPSTGTVIKVGPGVVNETTGQLITTTVKEGDRVFFLRYGGQQVTVEDKEYTILKETEILGIIR